MNRFHLEKTWFLWRLGNFCQPEGFRMPVPDQQDFHDMLLDMLPFVKQLFTKKWGKRNYHMFCEKKKCSTTLVLDGHQKATRRVCAIKNLYVPSIDGSIRDVKVGCSATPMYKSKRCREHLLDNDAEGVQPQSSHAHQPANDSNMRKPKNPRKFRFHLRCKTLKSLQYKRILHRTSGIMAAVYNCGYICSLYELFGSESITQVYNFLLYMHCNIENFPSVLIYDDACHLKLFIQNSNNFVLNTQATTKLKNSKIYCDKLHYRNHVDPWCHRNTNPYKDPIVNATNTEICEQIFSWLAQYKNIVRGFNESTFLIYLCLLSDLRNNHRYEMLKQSHLSRQIGRITVN